MSVKTIQNDSVTSPLSSTEQFLLQSFVDYLTTDDHDLFHARMDILDSLSDAAKAVVYARKCEAEQSKAK